MLKNKWLPLFRNNIQPMQTQTLESYQREIQGLTLCRNCNIKSSTKNFPKNLQRCFIFSAVLWGARKLENTLKSFCPLYKVILLYLFCLSSCSGWLKNTRSNKFNMNFTPPPNTQNCVCIKGLVWGHVADAPHLSIF